MAKITPASSEKLSARLVVSDPLKGGPIANPNLWSERGTSNPNESVTLSNGALRVEKADKNEIFGYSDQRGLPILYTLYKQGPYRRRSGVEWSFPSTAYSTIQREFYRRFPETFMFRPTAEGVVTISNQKKIPYLRYPSFWPNHCLELLLGPAKYLIMSQSPLSEKQISNIAEIERDPLPLIASSSTIIVMEKISEIIFESGETLHGRGVADYTNDVIAISKGITESKRNCLEVLREEFAHHFDKKLRWISSHPAFGPQAPAASSYHASNSVEKFAGACVMLLEIRDAVKEKTEVDLLQVDAKGFKRVLSRFANNFYPQFRVLRKIIRKEESQLKVAQSLIGFPSSQVSDARSAVDTMLICALLFDE